MASPLENVPGLGGYLEAQANTQARSLGDLQQAQAGLGLISGIKKQQDDAEIHNILMNSPDLNSAVAQLSKLPHGIETAKNLMALEQARQSSELGKTLGGNATPDQLDTLGVRLGIAGHPGAATVLNIADKRRADAAAKAALPLMQGTPQGLPAGAPVPGTTQQTTEPIPAQDMGAFMKVANAQGPMTATPQPGDVSPVKEGGMFAPFLQSTSPAIAARAKFLQDTINSPTFNGTAANQQKMQEEANRLTQLENANKLSADKRSAASTEVNVIPPEHSNLSGDDYLKTLPSGMQNNVKAVAEGRVPITSFSIRNNQREAMLQRVAQYDPTFEASKAPARAATYRDFTAGVAARNVTAINTAISHLGSMSDLADALQNTDYRIANAAINRIRTETGDARVNNFDTAKIAVANELMRVFRQVGASEAETKDWEKQFTSSGGPDVIKGAIQTGGVLLKGRIDALNDQWDRGMDRTGGYPKILSDRSKAAMAKFGVNLAGAAPTSQGGGWTVTPVH